MDCVVWCPTEDEMNRELELYLVEKYNLSPELWEIARKIYQQWYKAWEDAWDYDSWYRAGFDDWFRANIEK